MLGSCSDVLGTFIRDFIFRQIELLKLRACSHGVADMIGGLVSKVVVPEAQDSRLRRERRHDGCYVRIPESTVGQVDCRDVCVGFQGMS